MIKRLCLGGPKDGKWAELPDGLQWYRVYDSMPFPASPSDLTPSPTVAYISDYNVVVWKDGPVEVELLVHESVAPGETLRRLIECYKP
jgi:hypothetical protein